MKELEIIDRKLTALRKLPKSGKRDEWIIVLDMAQRVIRARIYAMDGVIARRVGQHFVLRHGAGRGVFQ